MSRKSFWNLQWIKKGIQIDGEFLNHLRFANDIVIFPNSPKQLQQMLKEINEASLKVGLSINLKKTKVMHNKHVHKNFEIKIDYSNIEVVDHYIYLEQLITINSASKVREIK